MLKDRIEGQKKDLLKDDDLEVNIEEKDHNLVKDYGLKNNHYDGFEDLNDEDFFKKSHNKNKEEYRLKKRHNNIEEQEDFVKEGQNNIEEQEDFLKEGQNNIEEQEDFLKEGQNNIEEQEDFLKEGKNNIEEQEDFLKEGQNNIEEQEDFLKEGQNNIEEQEDFLKVNHNNIEQEDCLKEGYNNIEEDYPKEAYKKPIDEYKIISSKTKVTSEMLPICGNVPHTSEVTTGPVTVKVPVVLTECTVTIAVESFLKLEDVISEIKHIRKNVYLSQCELIQSSEDCKANTGTLFLDGFINSDIEYATKIHNDEGVPCAKVKHVTVNVPFKCTTIAAFKTYPKFKQSTYQDETEILQTSINVLDTCGEDITGGDIREQSF